jgi:hypothetical protein
MLMHMDSYSALRSAASAVRMPGAGAWGPASPRRRVRALSLCAHLCMNAQASASGTCSSSCGHIAQFRESTCARARPPLCRPRLSE